MSDWANGLVEVFAESMRKRRTELALSAQKLEDRTASIGHKVTKAVISDLETGRRKRLYLPDALVIAEALNTSLATLLYPGMPDGAVEQVPGRVMPSWDAALNLLGIEPPFGDIQPNDEHEHTTGHALARASAELQDERETLYHLSFEFTSQDQHLDAAAKAKFLQSITQAQRRVTEVENRIEALGGVVYDEHAEGRNNG
ncbi:hypothetical protein [Corynebacterium coyleae]|uniref:hypothetical protein n=1 Tax=Corynebacterium coyleae TaxID=53374 RepID=UPI00254F2137|nr:hypothetical protein [Corynebacterium coyleae]MDK8799551.1 hypothetical protein [Corynebacterium coyleae]